jgi:DNA-binding NarL/FixJ family response regulator
VTTRVLVVDDHPVFRDGLAALLDSYDDIDVLAIADDGPDAIAAVQRTEFDVVVMDLNLPTMSGIEATARIARLSEPPLVLVVTMVDDDDTVVAALRAGARGYVLKGATGAEIVAALRTVASGGAVFGAGVAAQVLNITSSATPAINDVAATGLTEREREVLGLLAQGATNAHIARSLGLTVKTVQNYVSRILDKLQVSDRTQAALRARRRDQDSER